MIGINNVPAVSTLCGPDRLKSLTFGSYSVWFLAKKKKYLKANGAVNGRSQAHSGTAQEPPSIGGQLETSALSQTKATGDSEPRWNRTGRRRRHIWGWWEVWQHKKTHPKDRPGWKLNTKWVLIQEITTSNHYRFHIFHKMHHMDTPTRSKTFHFNLWHQGGRLAWHK